MIVVWYVGCDNEGFEIDYDNWEVAQERIIWMYDIGYKATLIYPKDSNFWDYI